MVIRAAAVAAFWIAAGFLSGGVMYCSFLPKLFCGVDTAAMSDDKNPGAANVFSGCGIVMGMICLLADIAKGFLPVFLAGRAMDETRLVFGLAVAAPVLGHAVGVFNRFRGGKCISTSFGVLLGVLPFTKIVFLLAVLYILFAAVIRIKPNRVCSIVTYSVFWALSAARFIYIGRFPFALACTLISATAILRHLPRRNTEAAAESAETEKAKAESRII